jgi:cell division protein FtsB
MTLKFKLFTIALFSILITFLSLEKVKLSFEISKLHLNNENLQIEYERFKDLNLRLQTQYYAENSVGLIERQSREVLGMSKQKPKIIIIDAEKK